jgi:hypothetical protein
LRRLSWDGRRRYSTSPEGYSMPLTSSGEMQCRVRSLTAGPGQFGQVKGQYSVSVSRMLPRILVSNVNAHSWANTNTRPHFMRCREDKPAGPVSPFLSRQLPAMGSPFLLLHFIPFPHVLYNWRVSLGILAPRWQASNIFTPGLRITTTRVAMFRMGLRP